MKRFLLLAARLYPRAWRERYGDEFAALADELEPRWREVADVAAGAMKMHLVTAASYWRLAGMMGAIGLIAGVGVSLSIPAPYVSTAVVRMPAEARDLTTDALTRTGLAEIIQQPSLDLYKTERRRVPMENVIQQMKRDVRVEPVESSPGAYRISFVYPDRVKARAATYALVQRFKTVNAQQNRNRAALWKYGWPEYAPPPPRSLDVLQPPADAQRKGAWDGVAVASAGMGLGLVAAFFVRKRRYAAFSAAGCVLAIAGSFAIPERYTSTMVVRLTEPQAPRELWPAIAPEPPEIELKRISETAVSPQSLAHMIQLSPYRYYPGMEIAGAVAQMQRNVSLRPVSDRVLAISFTHSEPKYARAALREIVSNMFDRSLDGRQQRIDAGGVIRRAAEHKLSANLEVLEPASLPEAPVSPNRLLMAAGGALAGLLAAALRGART